jgi:hypothetical protein
MTGRWIGVDLDATLAEYHGWNDGLIGAPVPAMVERVKGWLTEGIEVRIFTARVGLCEARSDESGAWASPAFAERQRRLIEAWCLAVFGRALPVTAQKDFQMIALYDDRAIMVEPNTGRLATGAWE